MLNYNLLDIDFKRKYHKDVTNEFRKIGTAMDSVKSDIHGNIIKHHAYDIEGDLIKTIEFNLDDYRK